MECALEFNLQRKGHRVCCCGKVKIPVGDDSSTNCVDSSKTVGARLRPSMQRLRPSWTCLKVWWLCSLLGKLPKILILFRTPLYLGQSPKKYQFFWELPFNISIIILYDVMILLSFAFSFWCHRSRRWNCSDMSGIFRQGAIASPWLPLMLLLAALEMLSDL